MANFNPVAMLMDEDDLTITHQRVTTPAGEYAVADIHALDRRVTRPILGPVLLALLGTLNLVVAVQTEFWLDRAAAGLLLGAGLYWRLTGARYVLLLMMPDGEKDIWHTRRDRQLQRALNTLTPLLAEPSTGDQA